MTTGATATTISRRVRQRIPARHRHRVHEFVAYGRALGPRPSGGTKVLIFAQGRTGTTLVESLLASTGLFRVNDEPLRGRGKTVISPSLYVRGLARDPARQGAGGNYICHVKVYHLDEFRQEIGNRPVHPAAFLDDLVRDGWRVIHVRREDRVRQALSRYTAEARGGYHKRDDTPESVRITVVREDFEAVLADIEQRTAQERAALRRVHHHEIVYERDLLDPARHERTVDEALEHLHLTREGPVSTSLRRINTRPLPELVANYDEFAAWVTELGFESSLEDGPRPTSSA